MRTITIKQPWAWLIVAGHKDIENRTWRTRIRGRVRIHAGKTVDPAGFEAATRMGITVPDELHLGAVIGSVEITDCVTRSKSQWWIGPIGFTLANARRQKPEPATGKLGFW